MTPLDDLIAAVEAGAWVFDEHDCEATNLSKAILGKYSAFFDVDAAYRGSLDAALRLHEALLPGCGANIQTFGFVRIYRHPKDDEKFTESHYISHGACSVGLVDAAVKPARAWLLAILRALKTQEAGQ